MSQGVLALVCVGSAFSFVGLLGMAFTPVKSTQTGSRVKRAPSRAQTQQMQLAAYQWASENLLAEASETEAPATPLAPLGPRSRPSALSRLGGLL